MGVDFSSLVLAPAMSIFSRVVTISPVKSRPNEAAYQARGVWKVDNVDIILENGSRFSNRTITLGIRIAEFTIAPVEGDGVSTEVSQLPLGYWQANVDLTFPITFVIDDAYPDGQGGCLLTLKRITPL